MIPRTFLYDEYIGRPKFTEQKKPIWVYSSSPPTSGVGTKKLRRVLKIDQSKQLKFFTPLERKCEQNYESKTKRKIDKIRSDDEKTAKLVSKVKFH